MLSLLAEIDEQQPGSTGDVIQTTLAFATGGRPARDSSCVAQSLATCAPGVPPAHHVNGHDAPDATSWTVGGPSHAQPADPSQREGQLDDDAAYQSARTVRVNGGRG